MKYFKQISNLNDPLKYANSIFDSIMVNALLATNKADDKNKKIIIEAINNNMFITSPQRNVLKSFLRVLPPERNDKYATFFVKLQQMDVLDKINDFAFKGYALNWKAIQTRLDELKIPEIEECDIIEEYLGLCNALFQQKTPKL